MRGNQIIEFIQRGDKIIGRPFKNAETLLRVGHRFQEVRCRGLKQFINFRRHHPEGGLYSWWDYRMLAFPKNDGLRLDYILATESLAKRCTSAEIDRQQRKGKKPSDHAPVVVDFTEYDA